MLLPRLNGVTITTPLDEPCNSMSIDIDWDALTTGPEGLALAESIKDFIHDKFQQVELPRFIRSVQVHSFDFGKECPIVELKDICDPLPEFYENDDSEDVDKNEDDGEVAVAPQIVRPTETLHHHPIDTVSQSIGHSSTVSKPSDADSRHTPLRTNLSLTDHIGTPLFPRSSTPGIPGGTSNLGYFHLPLSVGLSGTQTPLAAVAGGTPYASGWDIHGFSAKNHHPSQHHQEHSHTDFSSRPSTRESYADIGNSIETQAGHHDSESDASAKNVTPDPTDTQIVLHISYNSTVCLSITAEILLDYPMPSFVGIPLKLNIRGLSFDGVALIAYLRKRAHFCFLGPEDAQTLVGMEEHNGDSTDRRQYGGTRNKNDKLGGLLREIQVESEIGRQDGGKQVLKNVGKVEKFVLEQVRRIFEEEFVWPSFWTFLL